MIELPIVLTTYASLEIRDPAVLDLSRGEAMYGNAFEDEDALAEHLARNLIGGDLNLSSLDGWADLPDYAIHVRVYHVEADVRRGAG